MRAVAGLAWLVAALTGCSAIEERPAPGAIARLDEATFASCVEPALVRDCSYTDCHGRERMPFRLYSPGKLRLGEHRSLDETLAPLSAEERHLNFLSALGFTFRARPEDNLLLRKALPERDGGYEHVGGAIFSGPDDPAAVALRTWLDGGRAPCGGRP